MECVWGVWVVCGLCVCLWCLCGVVCGVCVFGSVCVCGVCVWFVRLLGECLVGACVCGVCV